MNIKNKRGISPVIATVLLIVVALILFLLIFMWLRGFQKEVITKQGTAIELMCGEINFDLYYDSSQLQITNFGDIPIHRADIYIVSAESTLKVEEISSITQGTTATKLISCSSNEQIKVIPVLLGETKTGSQKEYVCENQAQTVSC